jgi:putative FmdB family regulatory protein
MPTYQYRCTACGRELEAVQKFTDAALTQCPACSGSLRKVFNAVGVVFKGSGFYATDNRTKGKTNPAKPEPAKIDSAAPAKPSASSTGSTTAA